MASLRSLLPALLTAALTASACSNSSTSPSTTTTTTTTATTTTAATTTDTFNGVLEVGGRRSFMFDVAETGTVAATLTTLSGAKIPAKAQVKVGIGVIDDTGCAPTNSTLTAVGTSAQVSVSESAGTYCAMVWDVGNLAGPATFELQVTHP